MIKRIVFLTCCCFLLISSLQAQSWKKLSKQAEEQYKNGNYTAAAQLYEQAWQKKNKKKELIYKAGEAYYILRDYPNAAKAYANVKDENEDFPLAGLYYARSLKQSAQYDEAIQAFRDFGESYSGEGKAILEDIIRKEITGAEIGKVAAANADPNITLIHLGGGVNSDQNEFAAVADAQGNMFYASTMGGTARIYQTERVGERWAKGALPTNFPLINNGQFANPSVTPDGSRMYFTICEDGDYGNLSTRCEIYYTTRSGGAWSQPVRLEDNINSQDVTSTHPFVTQRNDLEILYFASNRGGGGSQGGMDIWYATRSLRTPGSGFSQPVNLGPAVNTLGDEITPFYAESEGKLYFSSNGHPTIGGFDIFVSTGDLMNWTEPVNAGVPFNSSADDYHYSMYSGGGFLTSNRVYGGEKLSTLDDDIFEYRAAPTTSRYSGRVLDASDGEPINYYTATLYEIGPDGRLTQLDMRSVEQGRDGFNFEVLPNRDFRIEIDAPGYIAGSQNFSTYGATADIFGDAIILDPSQPNQPVDQPDDPMTDPGGNQMTDPNNPPPPNNNTTNQPDNNPPPPPATTGEPYVAQGTSPYDQERYRTSAQRYEGVYYKVQIAAMKNFKENDPRYDRFLSAGDIQTEYLLDKGLYRVLIGSFFNLEDAKRVREQARSGGYQQAFVVKYQDGQRYGMIRLR